jgi:hypothetical protein
VTAILLPSTPAVRTAKPALVDFGGNLTPSLGGPVQRIERLGTRHGLTVELPPMKEEPDGRLWASALRQGKSNGVRMPWPQFSLPVGSPGSPTVNGAVAGGMSLPVHGLASSYAAKAGQFFSVVHGGRRYLYSITADTTASGGAATWPIFPMLRTALSNGDAIEMNPAYIEGYLQGDLSWNLMTEPYAGFSFTVVEWE